MKEIKKEKAQKIELISKRSIKEKLLHEWNIVE